MLGMYGYLIRCSDILQICVDLPCSEIVADDAVPFRLAVLEWHARISLIRWCCEYRDIAAVVICELYMVLNRMNQYLVLRSLIRRGHAFTDNDWLHIKSAINKAILGYLSYIYRYQWYCLYPLFSKCYLANILHSAIWSIVWSLHA